MPGASHQLAADLMPSSPQTLSQTPSPAAVLPGASQLAADDSPPSSSQPAAVLPGASQLAADNSPPSYSQLLSPAAAHSPGIRQAPSRGTLSDHDTQLDTSEVKPGSELCSFPVTDFGLPRSSLTSRRPWRLRPSCPSSWLGRRCSELAAASAPDLSCQALPRSCSLTLWLLELPSSRRCHLRRRCSHSRPVLERSSLLLAASASNKLAASRGGCPHAGPPCSHTANPGAGVCLFRSIKQGYFFKV